MYKFDILSTNKIVRNIHKSRKKSCYLLHFFFEFDPDTGLAEVVVPPTWVSLAGTVTLTHIKNSELLETVKMFH